MDCELLIETIENNVWIFSGSSFSSKSNIQIIQLNEYKKMPSVLFFKWNRARLVEKQSLNDGDQSMGTQPFVCAVKLFRSY